MKNKKRTRRSFLKSSAKAGLAAAAAPLVVPRYVVGGPGVQPPSDTAGIAGVGVGGKGGYDLKMMPSENIVALADVDWEYAAETFARYPDAKKYYDYRRMLDEMERQIDGVVIATPDHTHAVIAAEAMRRGLAVYVQKPLTWSVAEARALGRIAEETGVVTQMGNQGHSGNAARLVNEYVRDGAIGTVEEVHVWTNRPIWPQGMDWPEVLKRTPETLDWDLFLGPAPEVAYDPSFHPFAWRGWVDWGTSALGDMGAHLLDHPHWALELGYPETVETRSTSFNGVSWPQASMTHYHFPARAVDTLGAQPPVKLTWYDGGLLPERPDELPPEAPMGGRNGGALYVGSEGKLVHDMWGRNPRLLPEARMEGRPEPPKLFERVEGGVDGHEMNWVRAIKGEEEATADFAYAAPLTEVMLLGLVSMRAGHRKIAYDAEAMRVTNLEEANPYLQRQDPRKAWRVEVAQR